MTRAKQKVVAGCADTFDAAEPLGVLTCDLAAGHDGNHSQGAHEWANLKAATFPTG